MGCFMFIGIATRIVAEKKRVCKGFDDWEQFKSVLTKRFNANGIYDVEEDDAYLRLTLKRDVAQTEWLAFVQAFYQLRYAGELHDWQFAVSELLKYEDLDSWFEVAERRCFECYQEGYSISYPIYGEKKYEYATVMVDHIILSLAGKIMMECYDKMFAFFTRLIRERMASYKRVSRFSRCMMLFCLNKVVPLQHDIR